MSTKLITALDFKDAASALAMVKTIGDADTLYKVGLELFIAEGHIILPKLKDMGRRVFLDLKLHDIPNTAAQALRSCMTHGADIVNIHIQGGMEMMRACRRAVDEHSGVKPLLIGVTLLTSLDDAHLQTYGINENAKDYVIKLAGLAQDAGLDGVVSSAKEAALIKEECGKYFLTITPGIRLPENDSADQKRVVTPIDAARNGSDYIVVGRPITQSTDPRGTVQKIITMLESCND